MVIENKYFSPKLVAKEASVANSSCRVYYGEAGAIPFMWESQPGTPKHTFTESSLPPLTPPPSYSTTPPSSKHTQKLSSRSKFLGTIFPRLRSLWKALKVPNYMSPSSLSSASSSSSSASYSSSSWSSSNYSSSSASTLKNKKGHKHRCFSVSSVPFDYNYRENYDDDHHHATSGSPTSTLCFGVKCKGNANLSRIRGCYSVKNIKFAFLSIVDRESGRGTTA